MNKEEMQRRLEAIESEAKSIREALGKKKKWEPKGGSWGVGLHGLIEDLSCRDLSEELYAPWKEFGVLYPTKQQAEKAAEAFRKYHRLYAYVTEHAPDWEADWNNSDQEKYEVYYDYTTCVWAQAYVVGYNYLNVTMPEHVAEELVRKLNSGEVEL